MTDPVPAAARTDLERLSRRWHELPLGQALSAVVAVRDLAQRYADEVADARGWSRRRLPDVPPAAVPDQLIVTTYDVCVLRAETSTAMADVVDSLAALRRSLP